MGRDLKGQSVSQSPILAPLRNPLTSLTSPRLRFFFLLPPQDSLTCLPSPEWHLRWSLWMSREEVMKESYNHNNKPQNNQTLRWIPTSQKPQVTRMKVLEASLSLKAQLFSKALFNHGLLKLAFSQLTGSFVCSLLSEVNSTAHHSSYELFSLEILSVPLPSSVFRTVAD